MSSKYESGDSRIVEAGVALTDHALYRYEQRSPHALDLDPCHAWQRGEDIKHANVVQADDEEAPPQRARLYRHNADWGIVFLVVPDLGEFGAPAVVATCINIRSFDHAPTREYLLAHDVHGPGVADGGEP